MRRVLWNPRLSSASVFPTKDIRIWRPDTPSEGGGTWVFFIRTTCPDRICYHPDRASGHTIGGRRNVWQSTFHPDVSHPESSPPPFNPDIRIRRLTPEGRGGRFNFPGKPYSDPLIVLTWRVSQPFCTVPRCSPEASRYVRSTFLDIFL